MITKQEVECKYPDVVIDKLPDDEWNLLVSAMFDRDWNTVAAIMQPRQELYEVKK